MRPVPLPAMNPGPMTGEGNRTWLIHGARPVLVDAGVGEPRHLEALRQRWTTLAQRSTRWSSRTRTPITLLALLSSTRCGPTPVS